MLNSKAEINRCYLPRLRLADEKEVVEMEQAEEQENNEVLEELQEKDNNWINKKTQSRSKGSRSEISRSKATKKPREQAGGARPSKRRKFELIGGGWGEKTTENGAKTTLGMRLHDIRERSRDNMKVDDQEAPELRGERDDQEVQTILIEDDQESPPPPLPDLYRPGDHPGSQLDQQDSPVELCGETFRHNIMWSRSVLL